MGTENPIICFPPLKSKNFVKLNNPLMGTENIKQLIKRISLFRVPVKLNNPLMGTENKINVP